MSIRALDSPRWCSHCLGYGDHHTDDHAAFPPEDIGAGLTLDDYKAAVARIRDCVGVEPTVMVMHPDALARLNEVIREQATRRYRAKRWLRTKRARLMLRVHRLHCAHKARHLDSWRDHNYTYVRCTRCNRFVEHHFHRVEHSEY